MNISRLDEPNSYEERRLFNLIAEGDEAAFKQLFYRYLPQISPVVRSIVQSEAGAKDVIQDIFMNIWISRDKLTEIALVRNWIFRITYHQSYKWLRQQSVRLKAKASLAEERVAEPSANPVEESSSFGETSRLLRQAILALPPQTQKIYRLSREESLKINEIAEKLSLSPQTVKNTLSRALQTIRDFLVERGIYLPLILLSFFLA